MPSKSRNRRSPKRLARRMKPRRKGSGKKGSARARIPKKLRGGVTRRRLSQLTQQELSTALQLLPADVVKQIGKRHPLLIPPFTNDTLRRAVEDYLAGGARKERIVDKYGEINNWDVSNVTYMSEMFLGADGALNSWNAKFNQPLNNWDVSNVTSMYRMFEGAGSFNQPLNKWNVSKVTNMDRMFASANSFNQPLNNWDVSNVTDMGEMFNGATSFNQPLDNWNVSNVTDMVGMFESTRFNQPRHAPWYHSSEESEDESDVDSDSE